MATPIDDIARPDSELDPVRGGTTYRQKILDIWWRICSKTGLTRFLNAVAYAVLKYPVPKLDKSWKPTKVLTDGFTEIGAVAQNVSNITDGVAAAQKSADAATAAVASLRADVVTIVGDAIDEALKDRAITATTDNEAIADAVVKKIGALFPDTPTQ